jgi:hypothetical protein
VPLMRDYGEGGGWRATGAPTGDRENKGGSANGAMGADQDDQVICQMLHAQQRPEPPRLTVHAEAMSAKLPGRAPVFHGGSCRLRTEPSDSISKKSQARSRARRRPNLKRQCADKNART